MSEVTWLLILGAIALIFPVAVVTTTAYFDESYEPFMEVDFDGEYLEILNMNCSNIFDVNENYSTTNYEILRENMFTYFYPENVSWLWKPYIQFGCFLDDSYLENKINDNILSPDEVIEYQRSEEEKAGRGLIYRLQPNAFFETLGSMPTAIQTFIYSFYGLFFGYIIWRTFTIG